MKRGQLSRTRKRQRSLKASGRLDPGRPLADWCELQLAGCFGRATQRHERLARAHGGTGSEENTLSVCANCHAYIHAHPAESYERGWLIRSGGNFGG